MCLSFTFFQLVQFAGKTQHTFVRICALAHLVTGGVRRECDATVLDNAHVHALLFYLSLHVARGRICALAPTFRDAGEASHCACFGARGKLSVVTIRVQVRILCAEFIQVCDLSSG